jgi:hypothetical protein
MKECKPEFLDKAKQLGWAERERLLSGMAGKLPRMLESKKISTDEALAIQLELEDEQLQEWRRNFQLIRSRILEKTRE